MKNKKIKKKKTKNKFEEEEEKMIMKYPSIFNISLMNMIRN